MTPAEQARIFAEMLGCGVCLGVLYDLLGPLRRIKGMCVITDLVFGVCCALGMILTALNLQCDPFRLYAFAGAGSGMVLYGCTAGAVLRRAAAFARRKKEKWGEKYKNSAEAAGK